MTRQPTPDIMADLLGPVDDTKLIRAELRYNYELIPAEQRSQVQAAAVEIVQAGRRAQDDLLKIGQRLVEVKAVLEHGQFEEWCSTEFDMSQRTAQRMMQVAKVFAGKSDTVSLLSDSAMYLLAAPSTPEEARVEVIEQAQATGKSPTKAEVQETISRHKPAPAQTYLDVWKLEARAYDVAKEWDTDPDIMREGALRQLGSYWLEVGRRASLVGQYRISDLKQAINNVASRMEETTRRAAEVAKAEAEKQQAADLDPWTGGPIVILPTIGEPMIEVFRPDEEREIAADIASREAAAEEAARQAQEAAQAEAAEAAESQRKVAAWKEIDKPMVDWTAADWAKYEGRQAAVLTPDREERAVATADAAFGTKPQTRNERIDALLHIFRGAVDALPELGDLTGHYTATSALLRELNKAMQILKDNKIGGYKANE